MRSALALAAIVVVVASCSPTDAAPRSREEVVGALESAGLRVCTTDDAPSGIDGVVDARELAVAVGSCDSGATGRVVVATLQDEDDRDRIIAALLAVHRPRFADGVWTMGTTTVAISGVPDDEVVERVGRAMDALGANG